MKIAIQQPEHLPWVGFFDKMSKCDEYVYLDNVQFKKRYFENRNRIRTFSGVQWVTVPVQTKGRFQQLIKDVRIDTSGNWQRTYLGRLQRAYRKAQYFDSFYPQLCSVVNGTHNFLLDLNIAMIDLVREYLGITTRCLLASDVIGNNLNGSDLILGICRERNADHYISGPDGRNYLTNDDFLKSGIAVSYHDFVPPAYSQLHGTDFVSHMSVCDYIFSTGGKN